MAALTPVAVTLLGAPIANTSPVLIVGPSRYTPPANTQPNSYWSVVLERRALRPLVNVSSRSNSVVPTELQRFAADPEMLLFVLTVQARLDNAPQGAWDAFLRGAGSGPELKRAQQMVAQLGTGSIGTFDYLFAGALGMPRVPGLEVFNYTGRSVLTARLQPVSLPGQPTVHVLTQLR